MDETRCKWQEPEKTEKDGYTRDNLNIDEAGQWLWTARAIVVEVFADHSGDNLVDGLAI